MSLRLYEEERLLLRVWLEVWHLGSYFLIQNSAETCSAFITLNGDREVQCVDGFVCNNRIAGHLSLVGG